MKRTYSDVQTTPLPVFGSDDPRKLKSVLAGNFELLVSKVVDISKPTAKPVDEIDEPENEDLARENRMNQNNARMLQLTVRDDNGTEILALETERIPELDQIKENWKILVDGPVEVRCNNMMLERKHISGAQPLPGNQMPTVPGQTSRSINLIPGTLEHHQVQSNVVKTEEQNHVLAQNSDTMRQNNKPAHNNHLMPEDWDDFDDDDDDCIIIE